MIVLFWLLLGVLVALFLLGELQAFAFHGGAGSIDLDWGILTSHQWIVYKELVVLLVLIAHERSK